jgi:1-deoxy-D-xylulose-5-phosphate synthase
VLEALQDTGLQRSVLVLGLDDTFTEHGDPAHLMALQGLDAQGIAAAVRQRWPSAGL